MTSRTSSQFFITENGSVAAVFTCDGQIVSFYFLVGQEQVGRRIELSRTQAVQVGKRVAETGMYEDFPVSGICLSDIKSFGIRLWQYGENGC